MDEIGVGKVPRVSFGDSIHTALETVPALRCLPCVEPLRSKDSWNCWA